MAFSLQSVFRPTPAIITPADDFDGTKVEVQQQLPGDAKNLAIYNVPDDIPVIGIFSPGSYTIIYDKATELKLRTKERHKYFGHQHYIVKPPGAVISPIESLKRKLEANQDLTEEKRKRLISNISETANLETELKESASDVKKLIEQFQQTADLTLNQQKAIETALKALK